MAAVEVSITSRSTIKPSSATPPHLRTWRLSMIDQFFPNINIPFILFYSPSPSHPPAAIVDHLKLSLSHALTKFYPLAGRFVEPTSTVDCGDQGVDFLEAQVCGVADLAGLLQQNPGPDLLRQLVPREGGGTTGFTVGAFLSIQATVFHCGGVSLGVCQSHKILDGISFCYFLRHWAASATPGGEDVVMESRYFPPLELHLPEPELVHRPTDRTVQRRFVLDGAHLAALRSANGVVGAPNFSPPTRVEVVTGLFWRGIIRAQGGVGPYREGIALHMMNMRKHMAAPAEETMLGNFSFPVILTEEEGEDGSWRKLGLKLRNAAREMNYEKLQAARGPERLAFLLKLHGEMTKLPVRCAFSSLCGFPVYEVDFGWGKPAWAAFGGPVLSQFVFIVDRKDDEGVEVWVSLEHEEMERLITDLDLLSHASLY